MTAKTEDYMITMKNSINTLFIGLIVVAFITVNARIARATLGESTDSVESDRKAYSGVHQDTLYRTGYSIQDFATDGNVVREYISQSGVVFAIAWNGISHPDLTTLLGTHLQNFQQALQKSSRQRGKRHMQVKANSIIVEKWGHMRNLQGRAYIPSLIPSGVSPDEIK
jgi:hypothetical protein